MPQESLQVAEEIPLHLREGGEEVVEDPRDIGQVTVEILQGAADKFTDVRLVEGEGGELGELFGLAVEGGEHFLGRNAASQGCGQEGPGRESDVEVEVGDLPVDEGIIEGL